MVGKFSSAKSTCWNIINDSIYNRDVPKDIVSSIMVGRYVQNGDETKALLERYEEKSKKFGWEADNPVAEKEWMYRYGILYCWSDS